MHISLYPVFLQVVAPRGLLPLQSFLAFIRLSDRIGSVTDRGNLLIWSHTATWRNTNIEQTITNLKTRQNMQRRRTIPEWRQLLSAQLPLWCSGQFAWPSEVIPRCQFCANFDFFMPNFGATNDGQLLPNIRHAWPNVGNFLTSFERFDNFDKIDCQQLAEILPMLLHSHLFGA